MKKITLLFLLLFNISISSGQVIKGLIGTGTETISDGPISIDRGYTYSQQIYLASEVEEAIGNKNIIKSIKLHFKTTRTEGSVGMPDESSDLYKNWTVYMDNTENDIFYGRDRDDWIAPKKIQKVFEGDITFPNPTDNWFEIVFDTPFIWDGVSNIVLGIQENNPGATEYTYGHFRKTDTDSNRMVIYKSDYYFFDMFLPSNISTIHKHVPQIILGAEEIPSCMYPSNVSISDIKTRSVETTFNIPENSNAFGVEYHLEKKNTKPSNSKKGITVPNFSEGKLLLSNLDIDQEYFLWFRTKCDKGTYSEWSNVYKFKTLKIGQIGAEGKISRSLPLTAFKEFNYSQQIYLANEVLLAVGTGRSIETIKFYCKKGDKDSRKTYKDWKVFMGNTDESAFTGGKPSNVIPNESMSQVFDGEIVFPELKDDWFEIKLDTPFIWDGKSNIVVGVLENEEVIEPDYDDYDYEEPEYSTDQEQSKFGVFETGEENRAILFVSSQSIELDNLPSHPRVFNFVPQILFLTGDPDPSLGINKFDLTKLNYYPNPVKDVLTITYRDNIDTVEVYSLIGKRVLLINSNSNEVKVDMSQLPSSVYVIKIKSANSSQAIKVVKE